MKIPVLYLIFFRLNLNSNFSDILHINDAVKIPRAQIS